MVGINWVLYPRGLAAVSAGSAPLILTVREPVERIYSEFRMYADWKRACFRAHGLTFGAWVCTRTHSCMHGPCARAVTNQQPHSLIASVCAQVRSLVASQVTHSGPTFRTARLSPLVGLG